MHGPIVPDLRDSNQTSSCDFYNPGRLSLKWSQAFPNQSDQTCNTIAHQSLAKAEGGGGAVLWWSKGEGRGEQSAPGAGSAITCWKWTTRAVIEHCSLSGQTLPPHRCPLPCHQCLQVSVGLHVGCGFCLCHAGWHPLWAWAEMIGASRRTSLFSIFCWEIISTLWLKIGIVYWVTEDYFLGRVEGSSWKVKWATGSWVCVRARVSHLNNSRWAVCILRDGFKQKIDVITFVIHRNYSHGQERRIN